MHDSEYVDQMNTIMVAVQLLSTSPVEELREIVSKVETLGPILEPTAYQRGGHKRLYEQRRVLDAVANLVKVYRDIERENASVTS